MPEVNLHREGRDISVFINGNLDSLASQTEFTDIFPSLSQVGYMNDWKLSVWKVTLDIDTFRNIFLVDENVPYIKLIPSKYSKQRANYFRITGKATAALSQALTKENCVKMDALIMGKEKAAFETGNNSQYAINYTFPKSFLTKNVQFQLNLSKPVRVPENTPKPKLAPAHKIYDRIVYDPMIDRNAIVIGYLDRFTGIKETPFNSFITLDNEKFYNTSIPFHRIRYFKHKGNIVWDRVARLDLMNNARE